MLERAVVPPGPIDLPLTLGPLRHGPFDATISVSPGEAWRAMRTPDGPATIHIAREGSRFRFRAWGPGAGRAIELAPGICGFDDDPAAFDPHDASIRSAHRRLRGMRFTRTRSIMDHLVPAILEQKVTSTQAHRSYGALIRAFGEPAPGPQALRLPPDPARLAETPYWVFHPMGIERRRADTLRRACSRAARLEEAAWMDPHDAHKRIRAIQGLGPWTAAEVTRLALGDPDAVSIGDYHLPNMVAWNLAGEPRADDARMLELLEPYRGQRARAIRCIEHAGAAPPRFGPRAPLRSIARI